MDFASVSPRRASISFGSIEEIQPLSRTPRGTQAAGVTQRASWMPLHDAVVTLQTRACGLWDKHGRCLSNKQKQQMHKDVRTALEVIAPVIAVLEVLSAPALKGEGMASLLRKRCPIATQKAIDTLASLSEPKPQGLLATCWRSVKTGALVAGGVAYAAAKLLWAAGRALIVGVVWAWRKVLPGPASKPISEVALARTHVGVTRSDRAAAHPTKREVGAQVRRVSQDIIALCTSTSSQLEKLQKRADTHIGEDECEQLCIETKPLYKDAIKAQASLTRVSILIS